MFSSKGGHWIQTRRLVTQRRADQQRYDVTLRVVAAIIVFSFSYGFYIFVSTTKIQHHPRQLFSTNKYGSVEWGGPKCISAAALTLNPALDQLVFLSGISDCSCSAARFIINSSLGRIVSQKKSSKSILAHTAT